MAFPDVGVADDFNRADENPLSQSGAWYTRPGFQSLQVVSNTCQGAGDSDPFEMRTTPLRANCQVYVTISNIGSVASGGDVALYARCSAGAENGYVLYYDTQNNVIKLQQLINDAFGATLSSQSITPVNGDKYGLDIRGNTFTIYYFPNGGSWGVLDTVTDSLYQLGGFCGLGVRRTVASGGPTLDDFGAGSTDPAKLYISSGRPRPFVPGIAR